MDINAAFSENFVDSKGEELEIKLEDFKYDSLQIFCLQFAIRTWMLEKLVKSLWI